MQMVQWCAEMALGVPEVDAAHEAFLGELGRLADAPAQALASGVAALITLMEQDFRAEEALMEEIAFPGLRSHRQHHALALEGLHQAHDYIDAGDVAFGHATIAQLSRWFLIHLSTMDLALAVALDIARQSRQPPPTVFLRAQLARMLHSRL